MTLPYLSGLSIVHLLAVDTKCSLDTENKLRWRLSIRSDKPSDTNVHSIVGAITFYSITHDRRCGVVAAHAIGGGFSSFYAFIYFSLPKQWRNRRKVFPPLTSIQYDFFFKQFSPLLLLQATTPCSFLKRPRGFNSCRCNSTCSFMKFVC